jgi:SAM-dependent methyltransferase
VARFGEVPVHDPAIRGNRLAEAFFRVFGGVDTSSSHLHFMRTVKEIHFSRALDAGCGKGRFSFWLAQEYPAAMIDACDLSEEKITLCREIQARLEIDNLSFLVQDLRTYTHGGAYDFIFSNHVLEHISENRMVLAGLVSSLKPGGHIYVQVPGAIQRRLRFFRRFVHAHEQWAEREHVGQDLTLASLCSVLEGLGCDIVIARYTEGLWGELRFELSEMALSYFQSRLLFAVLYPLLKTLGYVDSLMKYEDGNGILVLARKRDR